MKTIDKGYVTDYTRAFYLDALIRSVGFTARRSILKSNEVIIYLVRATEQQHEIMANLINNKLTGTKCVIFG